MNSSIQAKLQAAISYIKTDLADVVGTLAVAHFKANFDREGFDGNKWDARTTKRKGSTNNQSCDFLSNFCYPRFLTSKNEAGH